MTWFMVSVHRRLFRPSERNRNPFLAGIPGPNATHDYAVRSWVFEARDEKHVRSLLKKAQDAGHTNVAGFDLRSIEQLPVCDVCGQPAEDTETSCSMPFHSQASGGTERG